MTNAAGNRPVAIVSGWSCQQTFHLHSWSFLPASPRESLAGDRRDPGLGRSLSRLERAHLRRVLCAQRRGAHRERKEPDHAHRQQLRAHQLQLRPHAAELAQGKCAPHLSHDPGRRERAAARATTATAPRWRRFTTTSSCRWPTRATASRRSAGASPTTKAIRQPARRHVAAGNRGRHASRWNCWPSTASGLRCSRRTNAGASGR